MALGDSYTSGEGAYDYRNGTDTSTNQCHSSVAAYPELITQALFSNAGGHSVACSGATIDDITNLNDGYHGQVAGNPPFKELAANQPRTTFICYGELYSGIYSSV